MLTIYHNNRCSKSREVLSLLEQLGRPFQVINYLSEPLDEPALRALLAHLEKAACDWIHQAPFHLASRLPCPKVQIWDLVVYP